MQQTATAFIITGSHASIHFTTRFAVSSASIWIPTTMSTPITSFKIESQAGIHSLCKKQHRCCPDRRRHIPGPIPDAARHAHMPSSSRAQPSSFLRGPGSPGPDCRPASRAAALRDACSKWPRPGGPGAAWGTPNKSWRDPTGYVQSGTSGAGVGTGDPCTKSECVTLSASECAFAWLSTGAKPRPPYAIEISPLSGAGSAGAVPRPHNPGRLLAATSPTSEARRAAGPARAAALRCKPPRHANLAGTAASLRPHPSASGEPAAGSPADDSDRFQ